MKRFLFLLLFPLSLQSNILQLNLEQIPTHLSRNVSAEWVIVGAGCAGIAVTGLLLDLGIKPPAITLIDPEFQAGRLIKYTKVPANVPNQRFIDYLNACNSFATCDTPAMHYLKEYDPQARSPLSIIVNPLLDLTEMLKQKIHTIQGMVTGLNFDGEKWHISIRDKIITANHVILATGSRPKSLPYGKERTIDLDTALDPDQLAQLVNQQDTVGVVGASHSAVLIMKWLYEQEIARIFNFYKHPLCYVTELGHENNGLTGITGQWAKEVLEGIKPANIIQIQSSNEVLDIWNPICDKMIYAIGFERNPLPLINGIQPIDSYDDQTGEIAPRLFGIGIAFPEEYITSTGNKEHNIGLRDFMEYAQRVMPEVWMRAPNAVRRLSPYAKLFMISPIVLPHN